MFYKPKLLDIEFMNRKSFLDMLSVIIHVRLLKGEKQN